MNEACMSEQVSLQGCMTTASGVQAHLVGTWPGKNDQLERLYIIIIIIAMVIMTTAGM